MSTPLFLSLLAALGAGSPRDGGAARDGGFDAMDPASWTLSARLGPGTPERAALIRELTAPRPPGGGIGETPLTEPEAAALLDDPRAQAVYGDKTVSIVAPSMLTRHRQEHLDLMKKFLAPEHVEKGRAFLKQHAAVFQAVEAKTGVAKEHIAGILQWESKLGTITGDWVAFNALASQAFFADDANKVALARAEEKALAGAAGQQKRVEKIKSRGRKNLIVLARQCKTRGIDVFTMKGSWAGALGFPQFMPASLRYADDGDGDGVIDLFHMPDAIASIGRYLKEHGYAKSPRDAVWDYNHEDAYVQGVLAFAEALRAGADGGVAAPARVAKDAGR